jgi:hypothetical protein
MGFLILLGSLVLLTLICCFLDGRRPPGWPRDYRYFPELGRVVSKSEARGLHLLKEWLSPAQLRCYEEHRYFEVTGSDSAKVYRIYYGKQANIDQLDSIGQLVCRLCFVPEGNLVAGDIMLAQKIALESSESDALAVANRFTIIPPR